MTGASGLGHTDRGSRDTAAESPPAAYSRRSVCGPPYHVGCESLVAPEDLRKQALRQVAPGQLEPERIAVARDARRS